MFLLVQSFGHFCQISGLQIIECNSPKQRALRWDMATTFKFSYILYKAELSPQLCIDKSKQVNRRKERSGIVTFVISRQMSKALTKK